MAIRRPLPFRGRDGGGRTVRGRARGRTGASIRIELEEDDQHVGEQDESGNAHGGRGNAGRGNAHGGRGNAGHGDDQVGGQHESGGDAQGGNAHGGRGNAGDGDGQPYNEDQDEDQDELVQGMMVAMAGYITILMMLLQQNEDNSIGKLIKDELATFRTLGYESICGHRLGEWWVKPRSFTWFDRFVKGYYDDARWKKTFRMSKNAFEFLCNSLNNEIEKQDTHYRNAIPVDVRVGCCLLKLFRGSDYHILSEKFGIGESSAHMVVMEVCKAIVEAFKHKIKFPSGANLEEVIAGFHQVTKLPNVAGAIDCTHFEIIQPAGLAGFDYYDRNRRFSIIMQAVCDVTRRFLDIFCGYPGSVHDNRVLRNSSLKKRIEDHQLLQEPVINIVFRGELKPYLLGDNGYHCSPWMMVPYQKDPRQMTVAEEIFNKKLKRGRLYIEQAFGLLKGKFKCLDTKLRMKPMYVPTVAHACCILHNLLIDIGETDVEEELEQLRLQQVEEGEGDGEGDNENGDVENNGLPENIDEIESDETAEIIGLEIRESLKEHLVFT